LFAECGEYPQYPYDTKDVDDDIEVYSYNCNGDANQLSDHMSQIPEDPNGTPYAYTGD
jgi:hypothetical protein